MPRVRVFAAAAALFSFAMPAATALAAPEYQVTVRRTAHGIPHITARDFPSLAYGYAQSIAQDNVCVLADSYVTVRAERSRYFGPDARYPFRGNGTTVNNLNSDFFYKKIIVRQTVERLLRQPPPAGPVPAITKAVRGYVDGYNDWIERTGVDNIPDPGCRGEAWVKPIDEIDVYRRFYQLALLASQGVAIDGIAAAAPVAGGAPAARAAERQETALGSLDPGRFNELLGGIGSNAYGLGKEATRNGGGMLLGNPHFPWDGGERFYQAHLTIPGEVDVQGGSLYGVPLILIGNTRNLAWSHTVSTARRFTPYQVALVPGSPTSYVVDGRVEKMTPTKLTVDVRAEDGSISQRSRTLYDTRWGPMLTSILGLPVFPWTPATGFALADVNATNFRYLNHFFFTNQAQSVEELDEIERKYLGIPWVNTIAADSRGRAYYADIGAIPNVSNAKIDACSVTVGEITDALLRVQVLDGGRSACAWDTDEDAIAPGIFGPRNLPSLFRDDYTSNMNDSYWLTNPEQPIEGFSRVIGDERTARSLRTRLGLRILQQRLEGSDGLPGKGFSLRQLQDAVFNNRQYAGELWRDELVALCENAPIAVGTKGPVDVSEACAVLRRWDLHDDLDSRGALLFRRFAQRALVNPVSSALPQVPSPFSVPFDVDDPVNTPHGLNEGSPTIRAALADAVSDLKGAGIPLDAPLRDFQFEMRGDERIPIHGGPGPVGVFNAINVTWNAARGYPNVPHGSSYVQAVSLPPGRCPSVRTILTYSQSTNPESRWFADQTRMFSRKAWVKMPYCPKQLAKARVMQWQDFGGGAVKALDRVRARPLAGGRVAVTFRLLRPARVEVGRARARRFTQGRHRVVVRRGSERPRVVARAGGRRYVARPRVRTR